MSRVATSQAKSRLKIYGIPTNGFSDVNGYYAQIRTELGQAWTNSQFLRDKPLQLCHF